ncbi:MAG: phage tail tape measure protein [Spirochaetota bacterium]|nr:phage tail tape measure protein [Spirochaetota bacterium]
MGFANKATQQFDRSVGSLIGRFATFAAVGGVVLSSVKKIADFEEAVSNLSAITGATGEDLDYLKNKAIELGKATTKSSIDTITAFKLIASAKPELLDNAQALAATAKEAIVLSEASGLELPEAATALTSALNQFNLSADESSRVINILAAGAKFAGAEIPDLTASLKEVGGIADSVGLSIEQTSAIIETISSKELKGSKAGIKLRNVFLRLASGVDQYNPRIVGLSKALENLAPLQDDVNKLEKMFGRESLDAAQALIKQRQRLDELTESMTGTNTAYEQARVNTDNLNSDIKRLSSAWEGFILNLDKGTGSISTFIRRTVIGMTKLIELIDEFNSSTSQIGSSKAQAFFEKSDKFFIDSAKTKEEKLKVISDLIADYNNQLIILERESKKIGFFTPKSEKRRIEEQTIKFKELIKLNEDYKESILNPITEKPKKDSLAALGEDSITKITAGAPKIFNINIENLIKDFSISTETITETAGQVRDIVTESLQLALADLQAVAQ